MSEGLPSGVPDERATRRNAALAVSGFAAALFGVAGGFQVLQGLALVAGDAALVLEGGDPYDVDAAVWGWAHVVLGAAGVAISVAILAEHVLGYLGGILLAVLGAIANFVYLPYTPLWSSIIIGCQLIVLWALCVCVAQRAPGRAPDPRLDTTARTGP